jgi:hypothetical protein
MKPVTNVASNNAMATISAYILLTKNASKIYAGIRQTTNAAKNIFKGMPPVQISP